MTNGRLGSQAVIFNEICEVRFGRDAAFNSTKGLPNIRHCRIFLDVRTVAETPIFQKYASDVWSDAERIEFINWIANNPEAGDVIPGSGGCRKVRWSSAGQGKRGGARVIYFNATEAAIWLLIVYKKAKFDNLPTAFLAELKKGVEDGL
ncbi:hypothetical protein [Limnobacter profundi]|uniref:hypothetical protein n=1 Tax=Limnobacter profundi TaxID=2732163 RepID=UPI0035300557